MSAAAFGATFSSGPRATPARMPALRDPGPHPKTPAARALVGCLAIHDGASLNQAARLAGYTLVPVIPPPKDWTELRHEHEARQVVRGGRVVKVSERASDLLEWMRRLERKLKALGVGRVA